MEEGLSLRGLPNGKGNVANRTYTIVGIRRLAELVFGWHLNK